MTRLLGSAFLTNPMSSQSIYTHHKSNHVLLKEMYEPIVLYLIYNVPSLIHIVLIWNMAPIACYRFTMHLCLSLVSYTWRFFLYKIRDKTYIVAYTLKAVLQGYFALKSLLLQCLIEAPHISTWSAYRDSMWRMYSLHCQVHEVYVSPSWSINTLGSASLKIWK